MTARLVALINNDLRLQARQGVYLAYGFVVLFYVAVLLGLGPHLPTWAVGLVLYSDPAAVGFFFLGALMLLEKAEGVRGALAASPVGAVDYLAGKVLTLASLSLVATVVIAVTTHPGANLPLLVLSQGLTALGFIGLGVPIALRFRTVNGYLVGAGAALAPFLVPAALALVEPMPVWFGLWPPVAQLRLALVATGYGSADLWQLVLMLVVNLGFAAATLCWAEIVMRRELGK